MFERQLIFLEVVASIANPVNKLYSLAYNLKSNRTFSLRQKKKINKNMNKWTTWYILPAY